MIGIELVLVIIIRIGLELVIGMGPALVIVIGVEPVIGMGRRLELVIGMEPVLMMVIGMELVIGMGIELIIRIEVLFWRLLVWAWWGRGVLRSTFLRQYNTFR